jgi:serine/threonine-protein kinase HipA
MTTARARASRSQPGGRSEDQRPTNAQVRVDIDGVSVLSGTLYSHRRRGIESASFLYDSTYLANPQAYALDPVLPLVSGTLQAPGNQRIFGAFSDSCPDRWGQRLIERAEARRVAIDGGTLRSFGQFDLLLRVRDDLRQGAIRFAVNDEFVADATGVPVMTDLPTLLSAADDVADDGDNAQSLALLLRAGSSLGGARPKAHVRDHNGRIAIAKFPSPSDTWNVMAWEATALDLAAKAEIAVPIHHLERVDGRNVLIVDRFDRTTSGFRRGYMSIMTALEASDGDIRSYVDIAEVLEERSSQVIRDLTELWRRIVFSILISNTDDHLRNHALLHIQADTWTLSPAFDLNPNPTPGPKHLSTAIDGDTLADIRDALAVAPLFRLDADQARHVLQQVRDAVAHWREVATHHGLTKSDLAAMAPAFEHAQATIVEQLLAG